MTTPSLASLHRRHWLVAAGFLAALPATSLPALEASAGERQDANAAPADRAKLPPSSAQRPVDKKESGAHWTFSAETIGLARFGGVSRTLIARVPGNVPFYDPPNVDTSNAPGVAAFNSNQFRQGFSIGPKLSLIYRDDSGAGVELSYFNIFNQSATKAVGRARRVLADAGLPLPGDGVDGDDEPLQRRSQRAAPSLRPGDGAGRTALAATERQPAGDVDPRRRHEAELETR
jgi:hypothetical protein